MKQIITLLICFACAGLLAQGDLLNINPVKAKAGKLLESRGQAQPGQAFDLKQLKELHRAIVGNRPNVWTMPEPMLQAMQSELEPLRSIAKQLAESALSEERYYGAILNSHLKQTDESRTLLLNLAHDDRAETAGTAMDTLFGLKLDTPELRLELVRALQEDKPPRERGTMYAMAKSNVGDWGVKEAVPVLVKLLEASAADGKPVDRGIVRQIKALGPNAESALPLLRHLAQKRRAAGNADFRELEDLDYAVLVVSGEYKAPQISGNQPQPAPTPPEVQQATPKKSHETKPIAPTPSVEPTSSTPWSIIVVLIGAAMGLLWLLLKRRS